MSDPAFPASVEFQGHEYVLIGYRHVREINKVPQLQAVYESAAGLAMQFTPPPEWAEFQALMAKNPESENFPGKTAPE